MYRRKYIEVLAGVAATSTRNMFQQPDTERVPDQYIDEEKLSERLDRLYRRGFPGFERDKPNVLFDVMPVGDNTLEVEVCEAVEELHGQRGVNGLVRQREEPYPLDRFLELYGNNVNKILGARGRRGITEREVEYPLSDIAVQIVVSPGQREGDLIGWLQDPRDNRYRLGFTRDSIALASEPAFISEYGDDFEEGKKRVLMHEIGHIYGLGHSEHEDDLMYSDVGPESDPDFKPGEWSAVHRRLEN